MATIEGEAAPGMDHRTEGVDVDRARDLALRAARHVTAQARTTSAR